MREGVIRKALSGFYYVQCGDDLVTCRARGKFRHKKVTPLVGDRVTVTVQPDGSGSLDEILPRTNFFHRPAVANLDQLVIIASGAIPVTDPFLIDRIAALAERKNCEPILCINKWDLVPAEELFAIYAKAGFHTIRTSAATGQGIEELRSLLAGRTSAFTGNSGVGSSSPSPAVSSRTPRAFPPLRTTSCWRRTNCPTLSGSFAPTWTTAGSWDAPTAKKRAAPSWPRWTGGRSPPAVTAAMCGSMTWPRRSSPGRSPKKQNRANRNHPPSCGIS